MYIYYFFCPGPLLLPTIQATLLCHPESTLLKSTKQPTDLFHKETHSQTPCVTYDKVSCGSKINSKPCNSKNTIHVYLLSI